MNLSSEHSNELSLLLFQDDSLSWYTNGTTPDFTVCFQNSIIAWIPCAFLWIISPVEVYYLMSAERGYTPWTWLNCTKIVRPIIVMSLLLV